MKKHILVRAILLIAYQFSYSQTTVTGGSVSGTWPLTGSPYNIQGSILIPNNLTLTIQPGVIVNFQGAYKILVLGRIIAEGNLSDSITFTTADLSTGWRGIRFDNTTSNNDTSKLSYCKLQYGKATGTTPDNFGGGLYFANFSKAIISNCSVANCLSNNSGGGIYCTGSSPVIRYNTISHNSGGYDGGGIFCDHTSNPLIAYNIISYNTAPAYGGGIHCYYTSPIVKNNIIINNSAGSGGGIAIDTGGPTILDNTISNNAATAQGGGIYCEVGSPLVINNIISYNSAINGGGLMFDTGYSSYIKSLSHNIISNNMADFGGGIYLKDENALTMISNNTFTNNSGIGGNNGGGIYCTGSSCKIVNCTIANNGAANGGALYCTNSSNPVFTNCILWGNEASSSGSQVFLFDEPSDPNFYYSDIQNGSASFAANGNFYTGLDSNNINSNPAFVGASASSGFGYNGISADWSLNSISPCKDAGEPTGGYPSTDLAGNSRVVGIIDMGAFEFQTTLEVPNHKLKNQLIIYPNPFNTSTTLLINSFKDNLNLEIYNLYGERIKEISNVSEINILDRSNLPCGLYFIRLKQDDKFLATEKIVISDN